MKLAYRLRSVWEEIKLRVRVILAAIGSIWGGEVTPVGRLYVSKIDANGLLTNYGLVCTKVVTDAGVNFLVTCLNSVTSANVFKYHGVGTGGTAEAAAQTALVTEVASRATGSQTVGGASNVYRTVGTVTFGGTFAITEHGIFSASTVGTMLDRSLFAAINVISGDSIQFTYDLTLPSGS